MKQNQNPNKDTVFFPDKKIGLHYSLYLVIGSVSLFASLVALNTGYQGLIWSYSTRYVVNTFTLAFALFLAGIMLVIASVRTLQKKKSAQIFGFAGLGFLVAYSAFVLFIDPYIAYTLTYILALLVLFAVIVIGMIFIIQKKHP
ncbi:MAG TPA: hypothetical protein VMY59_07850 [Candidatus Thermoplasmatota archaeon]|jgi:hypothetical protein|nr:hypothetical protein [Candidatus Thermoplasmatota archaeon]